MPQSGSSFLRERERDHLLWSRSWRNKMQRRSRKKIRKWQTLLLKLCQSKTHCPASIHSSIHLSIHALQTAVSQYFPLVWIFMSLSHFGRVLGVISSNRASLSFSIFFLRDTAKYLLELFIPSFISLNSSSCLPHVNISMLHSLWPFSSVAELTNFLFHWDKSPRPVEKGSCVGQGHDA